MFLIHAIKKAIESTWCAAQMIIGALVLLAVVAFKLDFLDDDEDQ